MLYEALEILRNEVNVFLYQEGLEQKVVLDNIALLESEHESAAGMNNSIVLTLLTIDEETTLRNFTNNRIVGGKTEIRNEKINLNLYVLFSGNLTLYKNSLIYISKVLQFFQRKNLFTPSNSQRIESIYNANGLNDFRFTMELYTPTFEDLNYIWGTLGGKQFPSALYKMSLVTIEHNVPVTESALITQTRNVVNNLSPNLDPPQPS
jgi:hypothetical protein